MKTISPGEAMKLININGEEYTQHTKLNQLKKHYV